MKNGYATFSAMITTSTVAMFAITYLNSWEWSHIFWSETRLYMVLYMGAVMAFIMLIYMRTMYTDRRMNLAILGGSAVVFGLSLWLLRSQATIEDEAWMKAMIPHHSIAILTSTRAKISHPRVRRLADNIIKTQEREIAEMKALIADLNGGRKATPEIDGR